MPVLVTGTGDPLLDITRLRDGLTLFVDNASRLEAAIARNTGVKSSALEAVGELKVAAAQGLAAGKAPQPKPEKAPELGKSMVKPFDIGL